MTKLSPDSSKAIIYLVSGIVAIVLVVLIINKVFGGLDKLLESLGLKDDEDTKKNKEEISDAVQAANSETSSSPWSPLYYKKAPSGTALITKAKADELAKQIYDSVGYFYDEPAKALAAFRQCPNRACVSWMVERFGALYGHDLLSWIKDRFDTKAQIEVMNSIVEYVNFLK